MDAVVEIKCCGPMVSKCGVAIRSGVVASVGLKALWHTIGRSIAVVNHVY